MAKATWVLGVLVGAVACGGSASPGIGAGDAGAGADAGGDASADGGGGADAGADGGGGADAAADAADGSTAGLVPLNDLGTGTYKGFAGGLYPNGANAIPAAHLAAGVARASAIVARDTSGAPSPSGKYVLLSIGMSNTTQEFCSQNSDLPCASWTFMAKAAADTGVNKATLEIVNGAQGGKTASAWDAPTDPDYDRVRTTKLQPRGLSEAQVAVVWVKVANAQPTRALPDPQADAYALVGHIGNIARALRVRYPNLALVLLSSRIYAGYATTALNPEPYAYESGLAVKWVVEAQIQQMAGGAADARAGNLDYGSVAPWIGWGPYLWANGTTPRSDGLTWARADLEADGTHPAQSGEAKVGDLLLAHFKGSPVGKCWFVVGGTCP